MEPVGCKYCQCRDFELKEFKFTKATPKNPRKLRCKWVAGEEVSLKHWRNALTVIHLYCKELMQERRMTK